MNQDASQYSIGIDVGGTFTDGIAMSQDGNMVYGKTPTTDDIYS
ncbi:MAG: hypothetical protein HY619_06265, partial [Thaumarchaeota archaeon]|nr:hypothetical protein [Nitrososphaerota archaeon]